MNDVCIDARMLESGGIGTYLKQLILRLQDRFPLHLIVAKDFQGSFPSCRLIRSSAPIYSLKEQWQLPQLIPKCGVFWSPHFNVPIGPIRARKRLVTIHDFFHLGTNSLNWVEKGYARFLIQRALKLSDHVCTISAFSLQEMQRYTSADRNKVAVIPHGIDAAFFARKQDVSIVQKKYSLPERFILFVGNVKPHKNLRGLIEAFQLLGQDLHLVIVGKREGFLNGADFSGLALNNVQFTGRVEEEELPSFYQLAELFAFPSFYEGFGVPPLEAMSAGCPVVASSAASIPEVCGDAVLYVDPHHPQNIAEGMKRILTDAPLRAHLVEKGLAHVQKFSWDQSVREHTNILQNLLVSPPR